METADKEARLQRAYERLGTNDPKCIFCSESNPHCLELHHIAGQSFGEELVQVCRNHHRLLSDDQKDHPRKSSLKPPLEECIAHFLLGLADLFVLLATFCRDYAIRLLAKVGVILSPEVVR